MSDGSRYSHISDFDVGDRVICVIVNGGLSTAAFQVAYCLMCSKKYMVLNGKFVTHRKTQLEFVFPRPILQNTERSLRAAMHAFK